MNPASAQSSGALTTVIVLSYDRPQLLVRALQSIARQTYRHLEVLVIDNRSPSSADVAAVVAQFPAARLIALAENTGFTGGMNRGLAEASGAMVYFTEDDIELEPACVTELVGYLEQHPEVALAGPVMLNSGSGSLRYAGGGFELGGVYRMTPARFESPSQVPATPFPTTYLPGAMICARRSLMNQIGGFRADFFMYSEDVELCARMLEMRARMVIVPAARVHHHEPASVEPSATVEFHKQKNFAAVYLLHAPLRVLPAFVLRYGVFGFLERLLEDRRRLPVFARAWWWVARHAPRLLAERAMRRHAAVMPVSRAQSPA
jgi:GT2 family glycosyltransferase